MRLNSVCGRWMNGLVMTRENRSTQRKTVPEHCVPPLQHDLAWHWTRTSPVRSRLLSTWAMVRPWSGPDCVVSNIWFVSERRIGAYVVGRGHGPVWSTCVRVPTINLNQRCWSPRRDFNLRYSECVEEDLSGLSRLSLWMWYAKFCDGR